jgi:short-subunit dehydrogenase
MPGTALITGASTGIGAVYADRLARRGHDLVLMARDAARLDSLAETLRAAAGVRVEVLPADLSDPAAIATVEARLAGDDVTMLVNNAGLAVPGPLATMAPDQLIAMLEVNIVTAARLARAVLPGQLARGTGTIINIGSVAGLTGPQASISIGYSASKAFILAFSEGLAGEIDGRGVRVQAVLPGPVRTPIWGKSGLDVDQLIPDGVMEAGVLVDAALRGLDNGETVTIPTLPDVAGWTAFTDARAAMAPGFRGSVPAARYA